MTEYTEVAEETADRVQSMFRSVEEEFEKLQQRVTDRREEFEKSAQKRLDRMGKEVRRSPLYKRAQTLRKDATRQIEKNVDTVLGSLNIATRSDIKKLDRKLNKIRKDLSERDKLPEA